MKTCLAVLLLATSAIAFAGACPAQMRAIDAKLESGHNLAAEQLEKVRKLRADGERLHKEGRHGESMQVLDEARQLLGI